MTLLNAPEFNEEKETRTRNVLIGSGLAALALVIIAFTGFVLGHGWFFMNVPVEHRVGTFLSALQEKNYPRAYGIFYNDPDWQQHPQKYKDYPLDRFTEDFTTESDWKGPVNSYRVDFSRRDKSGTVVASTINGSTNLTLHYSRADGTLAFFPYVLTRGF
ncbi:MAG TPA: hypothetical protein VHU44_04475 [Acidobacteriaceae bacterium]|jgi:hypothetical protein|nr:hypothetical protein [Acidobacteriaceae bacterium]